MDKPMKMPMEKPEGKVQKKPINKLVVFTLISILIVVTVVIYIYANREGPVIEVEKVTTPPRSVYIADKLVAQTEAKDPRCILQVEDGLYYVDRVKLLNILSKYKAKNSGHPLYPYETDSVVIRFDLMEGHRPKYFLLGDFFVVYKADGNAWNIQNGEALLEEILNLERIPTQ